MPVYIDAVYLGALQILVIRILPKHCTKLLREYIIGLMNLCYVNTDEIGLPVWLGSEGFIEIDNHRAIDSSLSL